MDVPEYLKIISKREVVTESFSRRTPAGGANKKPPQQQYQPQNELHFGGGIKEKTNDINPSQNEPVFSRNAVDPKSLEIKKKINEWTDAKKKEKMNNPMKILENNIRSNLNILTPDNFKDIKEKILELAKQSREALDVLVQKIIEKAWVEPKYIGTYAQLCFFLQNEKSLVYPEDKARNSETASKKKANNAFKSKLLEKIQKAFETEDVVKNDKKQIGIDNECFIAFYFYFIRKF